MAVDWTQAWQIGGIGFGLVFAVLLILAVTIWLGGLLLGKLSTSSGDSDIQDKGDQKLPLEERQGN